jgi:hypothetical protein
MREVLNYKPYKMHLTQQLYDEDMDLRVEMAELLLPILNEPNNEGLIFFSDEATFHISGIVNKHNCRIWSEDNPYMTAETALNSPKVTVWCAMSSKEIVGPFFFDELTVNSEDYLDMLKNFFYPFLQKKKITHKIILQQDGASIHFSTGVRSWLNEKFEDRWIGRGGTISWAPRSPDMTPLDFFLWGHIKNNIYKTSIGDLDDLKCKITQEIRMIKQETLHNVFLEVKKRLNFCISVQGDTFEKFF